MKELRLEDVFRYALSGGIGFVVLLLTYPKAVCSMSYLAASLGKPEGALGVTLMLGVVLLTGTVIYNVHRAATYPIFLRLLGRHLLGAPREPFWNPWKPSKFELDLDYWRSGLCDTQRHRWDEWGAQTHSLYCGAWAIFAALTLGCWFWGPPNCRAWYMFLFLFFVTWGAAMVTNYRLLYSITDAKKRDEEKVATR
jgi:hypothetical protein